MKKLPYQITPEVESMAILILILKSQLQVTY